jgi:putative membrane protein
MMGQFGMGFGLFGLLLMLIFWGFLVLLAVWLVKALFQADRNTTEPPSGSDLTAREILNNRYARGEISREQYELMKEDL